jgi:DNA-directed RNA polymerase beta subunit
MIKPKIKKIEKIVIDLDGPDGNVFILMGIAKKLMNQIDRSRSNIIIQEMMNSDYLNAVYVFEREFGSFVELETSNEKILNILV